MILHVYAATLRSRSIPLPSTGAIRGYLTYIWTLSTYHSYEARRLFENIVNLQCDREHVV